MSPGALQEKVRGAGPHHPPVRGPRPLPAQRVPLGGRSRVQAESSGSSLLHVKLLVTVPSSFPFPRQDAGYPCPSPA